ncbi:MAG: hypothetical protein ACLGHP_07085, partial [Vicinamibacteria bacterium]
MSRRTVTVLGSGSWGTALATLFVAIMFTTFLLGYFYLRLDAPSWPPASPATRSWRAGSTWRSLR